MVFLDIFGAHNDYLVIGLLMGTFWPNLWLWQLFKEGTHQGTFANFALIFLSNGYNLGLEWTFSTFSVHIMIAWSLACWWAQKFFDFWSNLSPWQLLYEGTRKGILANFAPIFLSNGHDFGRNGLFWHYRCTSWFSFIAVGRLLMGTEILNFNLICTCGSRSKSAMVKSIANINTLRGCIYF